jgi:carbonic anhydrase
MTMNKATICGVLSLLAIASQPILADSGNPSWGYTNQNWALIKDTTTNPTPLNYPYSTCGVGDSQAPVNITGAAVTLKQNSVTARYPNGTPTFYNTGYAVQVNAEDGYMGHVSIGNDQYPLVQFHFHAPSEHTINGASYDAELHFVNIMANGKAAVLTSLISVGAYNAEFQKVLDNVPRTSGAKNSTSGVKLNPMGLLPSNRREFFTYGGSLTTPPCAEGINFYVFKQPITISSDQLAALKAIYSGNNRKTQDLNGRVISSKR